VQPFCKLLPELWGKDGGVYDMSRMKSIHFPSPVADAMVRAILDGRKSVTRRVVKPQPRAIYHDGMIYHGEGCLVILVEAQNGRLEQITVPFRPGITLYVQETWAAWSRTEGLVPKLYYKADGNVPDGIKWHPSIHMPKEAARLFLRVTDVRVERLQEITEDGAKAEGYKPYGPDNGYLEPAMLGFIEDWDSTIKEANLPLYGWAANPWVWVIEFKRISKEEALKNA